mgnify:CR=1 FL=1
MTESKSATDDNIGAKMDRVRNIIEQLENGDVSLERAKDLRDEGKDILSDVESDLDLGEGTVTDRE